MTGTLYRYLDPIDLTKTLYVGQGAKRDRNHRSAKSSFGRRFTKRFPHYELPQPIRWTVEVSNQLELNEAETIAMFQFHSWQGYEGGMNLRFPGDLDYKCLGHFGMAAVNYKLGSLGRIARARKGGILAGAVRGRDKSNVEFMRAMGKDPKYKRDRIRGARVVGQKNLETGHIYTLNCMRWNIHRGKSCVCGRHQQAA